jgi:hypothetical protein
VNIDTVPMLALATASRFPDGLKATEAGWDPVPVEVEPTAVSEPQLPTVNIDTVFEPKFATANSAPEGLNASESGAVKLSPPEWCTRGSPI